MECFRMKIAYFDIDGVLANDTHRVEHAQNKRWDDYFHPESVAADAVWQQGQDAIYRAQGDGWTIAYMTGRWEALRDVTQAWLDEHGFPAGELVMRPLEVTAPLAVLKAGMLEEITSNPNVEQIVLYDDDPEVVREVHKRLGRSAAIHCTWHIKRAALVAEAIA